MTALKKASERERERYMWGVGKAHTPHIPPFPADGSFFQQTHFIQFAISGETKEYDLTKRAKKPVGLTRDAGWQIGVRRTLPISHTKAWSLITSPEGVRIWLGAESDFKLTVGASYELKDGTFGEVRVYVANSHLRITWHPKDWPRHSTIQIRIIPRGAETVIAFHQEHLPGAKEREGRRAFFKAVLNEFEAITQKQ